MEWTPLIIALIGAVGAAVGSFVTQIVGHRMTSRREARLLAGQRREALDARIYQDRTKAYIDALRDLEERRGPEVMGAASEGDEDAREASYQRLAVRDRDLTVRLAVYGSAQVLRLYRDCVSSMDSLGSMLRAETIWRRAGDKEVAISYSNSSARAHQKVEELMEALEERMRAEVQNLDEDGWLS